MTCTNTQRTRCLTGNISVCFTGQGRALVLGYYGNMMAVVEYVRVFLAASIFS